MPTRSPFETTNKMIICPIVLKETLLCVKLQKPLMVWVLVVGGLLWGYEGATGTNLLMSVLGAQVAMIVEIVVGVIALIVAYLKLTGGKK